MTTRPDTPRALICHALVGVVIIALLFGGSLLGIVAAMLAVPTAAILQVLFEEAVPDASSAD